MGGTPSGTPGGIPSAIDYAAEVDTELSEHEGRLTAKITITFFNVDGLPEIHEFHLEGPTIGGTPPVPPPKP